MENNGDIDDTPLREGNNGQPSMKIEQLDPSEAEVPPCGESPLNGGLAGIMINHVMSIKEEPQFQEIPFFGSTTSVANCDVKVKEEQDLGESSAHPYTSGPPSHPNLSTVKQEPTVNGDPLADASCLGTNNQTSQDGSITQLPKSQATYNCVVCQMQFCSVAELQTHWESHQGENKPKPIEKSDKEKPLELYICSFSGCQREFLNKAGLNTHSRRFHENVQINPPVENSGGIIMLQGLTLTPVNASDIFRCSFSGCQKLFLSKNLLLAHQESHQTKKESVAPPSSGSGSGIRVAPGEPFVCMYCGASYKEESHLKAHVRTHPEERPYHCQSCTKTFSRRSELVNHLVTHSGMKPYACPTCGMRFTTQSGLVGHSRIHNRFCCPECGDNFKDQNELNKHKRLHELPFECPECGKRFEKLTSLVVHQLSHSKEAESRKISTQKTLKPDEKFTGADHGKSLPDKATLEKHQKMHKPDEKFTGADHGKSLPDKATLEKHQKTHKPDEKFAGDDRSKSLPKATLGKPQKMHKPDEKFTGADHGKSLPDKATLGKPQKMHKPDEKIASDDHSKSLPDKATLDADLKSLIEARPHVCSDCGKRYIRPSELRKHSRVHGNNKPYTCSECGQGFTTKLDLEVHRKIHQVKKLHRCSECGKEFSAKRSLRRHLATHFERVTVS